MVSFLKYGRNLAFFVPSRGNNTRGNTQIHDVDQGSSKLGVTDLEEL